MNRMMAYFRETSQEMKRVSWPTRDELKESTGVVIITVAVITVCTFVVDWVLDNAVKQIIRLG